VENFIDSVHCLVCSGLFTGFDISDENFDGADSLPTARPDKSENNPNPDVPRKPLTVEQRLGLRRSVRYLVNALYLVKANKSNTSMKSRQSSAVGTGQVNKGNKSGKEEAGLPSEKAIAVSTATATANVDQKVVASLSNEGSQSSVLSYENNAASTSEGTAAADSDWGGVTAKLDALEDSILLKLSYVHLCMNDPVCTLQYTKTLLSKALSAGPDRDKKR